MAGHCRLGSACQGLGFRLLGSYIFKAAFYAAQGAMQQCKESSYPIQSGSHMIFEKLLVVVVIVVVVVVVAL